MSKYHDSMAFIKCWIILNILVDTVPKWPVCDTWRILIWMMFNQLLHILCTWIIQCYSCEHCLVRDLSNQAFSPKGSAALLEKWKSNLSFLSKFKMSSFISPHAKWKARLCHWFMSVRLYVLSIYDCRFMLIWLSVGLIHHNCACTERSEIIFFTLPDWQSNTI